MSIEAWIQTTLPCPAFSATLNSVHEKSEHEVMISDKQNQAGLGDTRECMGAFLEMLWPRQWRTG